MIPTWYFSSSKHSPDISQLNVTLPCPVSGCPPEREPCSKWVTPSPSVTWAWWSEPGGQLLQLHAAFHLGSTLTLEALVPSAAVDQEGCTGPGTLKLLLWLV